MGKSVEDIGRNGENWVYADTRRVSLFVWDDIIEHDQQTRRAALLEGGRTATKNGEMAKPGKGHLAIY